VTKVVLDTNVLVSVVRSPDGKPAQIMSLITGDEIEYCYSEEILAEYQNVLARDGVSISQEQQEIALNSIEKFGTKITRRVTDPTLKFSPP